MLQIIIGIIVLIIVVQLVIGLIKLLIEGAKRILPYVAAGIAVIVGIYFIIAFFRSGIVGSVFGFFGGLLQILGIILIFAVISIALYCAMLLVSQILRMIHLRWALPLTLIVALEMLAPESAYTPMFMWALAIQMLVYDWSLIKHLGICRHIGYPKDINSDMQHFYASFCSSIGCSFLYILDFPRKQFGFQMNTDLYICALCYIFLAAAIFYLRRYSQPYQLVKKYIKQTRKASLSELMEHALNKLPDDKQRIYAQQIIARMKKRHAIQELLLNPPVFLQGSVYRFICGQIQLGKGDGEIAGMVSAQFDMQDSIYIIAEIRRCERQTHDPVSVKKEPVKEKLLTESTNIKIENEVNNTIKAAAAPNDALPAEEIWTVDPTDAEFVLLRYDLESSPIVQALPGTKNKYFQLFSYMTGDLKKHSEAISELLADYRTILGLAETEQNPLTLEQLPAAFKGFSKREWVHMGFLKWRIRDYRYLLLLETFYFRSAILGKLEIEKIDTFCQLLKITGKSKQFITDYMRFFSANSDVSDAEIMLLKCKNKYILDMARHIQEMLVQNRHYSCLPRYHIAVCATMSSGKSTFINALLGRDYIPSKNEACTAKITSISDNDYQDVISGIAFKTGGRQICKRKIDVATLDEWNGDSSVSHLMLEGDLDGIRSVKGVVVVNDTPGTNYSQDKTHHDITINFLRSTALTAIIYLINAEHASTTDSQMLLAQIHKEVLEKQDTKMLFLVNKVDSYDCERTDDLEKALQGIREELIKFGFNAPEVFPISANAARLFKMVLKGDQLSKKENMQFCNMMETFSEDGGWDLSAMAGSSLKPAVPVNPDEQVKIGANQYTRAEIANALHRTGITAVEAVLDDIVNQ